LQFLLNAATYISAIIRYFSENVCVNVYM